MKKVLLTSAFVAFLAFKGIYAIDKPKKSKVNTTDVSMLYSHYIQNGNHSAVTGGTGTEKLNVYAPSLSYKYSALNKSFALKIGTDVISSASTDNIDFIQSSASRLDARTYANLNFSLKSKKRTYNLGTGFSIESDYFSRQFSFGMHSNIVKNSFKYGFDVQLFFDDLRWGRLNSNYKSPQKLIYPVELRTQNWFNTYNRNSFNLKPYFHQFINKYNEIAFFPEVTIQTGLISTPFHRVYFNDASIKVENLPNFKSKLNLGTKFNHAFKSGNILKVDADAYSDNFGVLALSSEFTYLLKINPKLKLSPFLRIHYQSASKYFSEYRTHLLSEIYYTSDFDLSNLSSIKLGAEIQLLPVMRLNKHLSFKEVNLRYAFYKRSDGLFAHNISLELKIQKKKRK